MKASCARKAIDEAKQVVKLVGRHVIYPQGQLMKGVVYIVKCSGCGTFESVSVSPIPKGCVPVSQRDENGDSIGQDSA